MDTMTLLVTESTPLLLDAEDVHVRNAPVSAIGIDQTPLNLTSYAKFLRSLAWDSISVILSYILQNSIQTTSIVVTGRLGPHELSVAAFSHMFAFAGGERKTDLSIHFQRCVLVLWVLMIPVGAMWAFIEPLLLAFGQPVVLARDVQKFLRILTFGAPAYVGFESLKKYLQCQGIMGASTRVLVIVFPINLFLNVVLVHYTPLGLFGAPLAVSVTYWLCFISLGIFTYFSDAHKQNGTWGGFQIAAVLDFRSCFEFLKLALPGTLMVGTEWAAFEIVALAAGRLGEIPLAAILNTLPFGIGVAASTRVGNLLGSRSPTGAKTAAHSAALLSVIVGLVVMTSMMLAKDVFGLLFSDDKEVASLVSRVMPLVASFQVADGLAGSCGGVLRGQGQSNPFSHISFIHSPGEGRQHLGALFNLVAYYVLALPMGFALAFDPKFNLGLQGLWIGQVLALFIVGIGEYCVVWLGTDWELEVKKGIERNREEAKRRA
ncbi:hypothetical protein NLJ89_g7630 [Agrocybe chaxingu]|uniref:Uncharacterized protein n=1 Tax=Agrocybe chaxingu TaxID=84603 RepID=A0A9W8MSX6_9AGAR|nr:hypothetical protein NLJ89_g7630 [Agrocybe chaxingu]